MTVRVWEAKWTATAPPYEQQMQWFWYVIRARQAGRAIEVPGTMSIVGGFWDFTCENTDEADDLCELLRGFGFTDSMMKRTRP